jgi:lipoate-protein ligase A
MNGLLAWWDPPAAGPENMAADEVLAAESVRLGRALVRVYGWTEPTVSLGGFQQLADAWACPGIAGLPLVRRPSGGGAIVHGGDLTYAVAVPRDHPWGGDPQVLYDAFHTALAGLLQERGVAAGLHPGRDRAAGDEKRFLCFDRRARGDLVVAVSGQTDGHKILGSAQRRLQAAVLQHGSLLERSPPHLSEKVRHLGLWEFIAPAEHCQIRNLVEAWFLRATGSVGGDVTWQAESFLHSQRDPVTAAAARFRSPAWLSRR